MGLFVGSKVAWVFVIDASLLARSFAVSLRRPSEACVGPRTMLGYSMACWPAACFQAAPSTRHQSEGWARGISWVADVCMRASTCILCISVYISIRVYKCIYVYMYI